MNFKTFISLDENIIDVIGPLIGQQRLPKPFSLADMINALNAARLNDHPDKIKAAIKMLDTLIDYVITLSDGQGATVTINGIKEVKEKLIAALRVFEK